MAETKGPRVPCIAHLNTRQVSSQLAFRFMSRSLKWISDWNDLATFILQIIPILPTRFPVNCHFGSGEKNQNIVAR